MRFRPAMASIRACVFACACASASAPAIGQAFVHPGLLHTRAALDRARAQVAAKAEPWLSGWKRLDSNSHASATYQAHPVDTVYRGTGTPENYAALFNDIAAAYANALEWSITGNEAHADAAMRILDAWSGRLKAISGTTDKYLAAGIYGYEFANAAELMCMHPGWNGFARSRDLLRNVFYPLNHEFLADHHGSCISHYWANWDLVNMASVLAIGILSDDRAMYGEAVAYFKTGAGNGSVRNAVWYIHPGGLGQWQEAGRDQGHSLLGPAILGAICEMAWSQGDDLYGYDDNRVLKGFEYVAKYNLGDSVPYVTYDNCDHVDQRAISPDSRGGLRPGWEMIFNHYARRKGLAAPNCQRYAEKVRPEGGGGDYGPNSGGYDQLGYGTLMASLPEGPMALFPIIPPAASGRTRRDTPAVWVFPGLSEDLPVLDALGRFRPARLPRFPAP
jgi:hypothetical protein